MSTKAAGEELTSTAPSPAPRLTTTPPRARTPLSGGRAAQFTIHERDGGLRRADLDPSSPVAQFQAWFAAAQAAGVAHPETCTLATAHLPSGRVSARMVYLKELEAGGGFVLYSNFATSRKAADLASNPHTALTFWWEAMERQVRVEGRAARLSPAESQAYFASRVRGSRIGAWASRQSEVLPPEAPPAAGELTVAGEEEEDDGRRRLDRWVAEAEERFGGVDDIPVPDFWGGLRIVPDRVEFWQGRANRLHDRFVYERVVGDEAREGDTTGGGSGGVKGAEGETPEQGKWTLERLSP